MRNNAKPRKTRLDYDYLKEVGIYTLAWPAQNHDLNPIEHFWNYLNKLLVNHKNVPHNLNKIKKKHLKIWNN